MQLKKYLGSANVDDQENQVRIMMKQSAHGPLIAYVTGLDTLTEDIKNV